MASFYALFSLDERPPTVTHVCDDIACLANGAEDVCRRIEQEVGPAGDDLAEGLATWLRSPCLGQCDRAPALMVQMAGEQPGHLTFAPVEAGLAAAIAQGRHPRIASPPSPIPQADGDRTGLRLLRRVRQVEPESLDSYRAHGGYEALRRAVELGQAGVIEEVKASKLLGRGGAAFPTGVKWEAVASQPVRPHFFVCNADESEPGTFKDRVLMEDDPFALVEALTIAGFATGSERGYVYIRGEYPFAERRVRGAIDTAREHGLLGDDVAGYGFAFEIEVRRGAGAYIAGEETALFNSIEGKRAEPRNKPPFPVTHGLFGKPTGINNVETLLNVLEVLRIGGEEYAKVGTPDSTGTRLFCLSGCVARPGLYEVEFGATLRRPARAGRRGPRRPNAAGRPAGRGGRLVRRAREPGPAAHLRGDPGRRDHARVGSDHGLRPVGGSPGRAPARRGVLPRRVLRPVRALPRRDRPAGGAAPPAVRRDAARLDRRRSWRSSTTSPGPCATRRSAAWARPRPAPSSRPSSGCSPGRAAT